MLLLGGNLVFTFSSPIQSFGAYLSGIQLSVETINFSDGSSQSVPIPQANPSTGGIDFVGFTDSGQQITSVTINAVGDIIGVDDVLYGATVTVPEPATLTMLAIALAALCGMHVLRWRQVSARGLRLNGSCG